MCDICDKAKKSSRYNSLLSSMQDADLARLENSKKAAPEFPSIQLFSTIEYPKLLVQPMFEPRPPYSNPSNYFQSIFLNGERLPVAFSHGSMRSIFFLGKRLMVFTKSVASHEGEEFFSSFLLAHFDPGEYSVSVSPEKRISVSAEVEKSARNLLSGKVEKVQVNFAFAQDGLEGRLMRKDDATASTLYANQAKVMGAGAKARSLSSESLSDYVSTVPFISPHPYLFQIIQELGYPGQQEFQLHVVDYFRAHLPA
jgi:hypothetical protein